MFKISTQRLEIIAEDLSLARAGVEGPEALAAKLSVTIPEDWPPQIMADAVGYWVPFLEKEWPSLISLIPRRLFWRRTITQRRRLVSKI